MVTLDKIYTRGGDKGETSLVGGARVAKYSPRVRAFGAIDEANAALGWGRCHIKDKKDIACVARIQNDLFDVGADLARPMRDDNKPSPRMDLSYVTRLEQEIDAMNEQLEPLRSFILPGGTMSSAALHLARTMVRRAESLAHEVVKTEGGVNHHVVMYLNRLSDHLFVFSRLLNDGGKADILWQPGQSMEKGRTT